MLGDRRSSLLIVCAVVLSGALLRALPLLEGSFPVNDGGMFMVMAEEIREAGFGLPAFTAYNASAIPFAYPPLGLYLTAFLGAAGMQGADALRFAPFALSVASIPMVHLIGRELLGGWRMGVLAAGVFAFTTGSYRWLVMGGGVTRALGFLLALVAVYLAIRLYREHRGWMAVGAGVALGATGLSHPQAAVFGAMSVVLLLPFVGEDRRRCLLDLALVVLVAAAVVAPWVAVIVLEHGIRPLLSATSTGGPALLGIVSLASSRTSGGFLEIIGIATSLGFVVCALRRYWLPVAWALAIAIVDSRAGQPYLSVPAAMAVSFLARDVHRMIGRRQRPGPGVTRTLGWKPMAIVAVFLFGAFLDSAASQGVPGSPLRTLPVTTRHAMSWVAAETEPDATFAVVSGWHWALDAEAEWFPALSGRQSLATVQGSEWLGTYARQVARAAELPDCVAAGDITCIERWFDAAGEVDYLFLVNTATRDLAPNGGDVRCCQQLAGQIDRLFNAEEVHREGDVLIVRLVERSQASD